jgi:hypothetical protein
MILSIFLFRRWTALESEQNKIQEFKDTLAHSDIDFHHYSLKDKIKNLKWIFQRARIVESLQYHLVRSHFIHSNRLSANFCFDTYLKKCAQHVFIKIGTLHKTTYMLLLCLVVVDMLIRSLVLGSDSLLTSSDEFQYFRYEFVIFSFFLVATPISVLFKTREIYSRLLKSGMLDFDPYSAEYFFGHAKNEEIISHMPMVKIPSSSKRLRVRAESSVKKISRILTLDRWSENDSKKLPNQMDLFWFHSHIFIIRILQACIFLLAIYLSLIFQFRRQFLIFTSSLDQLLSVLLLFPLPIFLVVIPLTLPTYSMIIHIGQLVDLEVVQEAIEKVNKKIALEMQKKEEEERMKGEEQKEQIVSLLAREGTIATLSQTDQVKYKIAGFLFETFWETMLTWICVIDAALIGLFLFQHLGCFPSNI